MPVMSFLMAVSVVSHRDPATTSSLASLMKDDACSKVLPSDGRKNHVEDRRTFALSVSVLTTHGLQLWAEEQERRRPPASRAFWSHAGDEAEEAYWEDELDADDDGDDPQEDTAY